MHPVDILPKQFENKLLGLLVKSPQASTGVFPYPELVYSAYNKLVGVGVIVGVGVGVEVGVIVGVGVLVTDVGVIV
jgi:hypothetical protein